MICRRTINSKPPAAALVERNRKSLAEGGPLETFYTVVHQDWQGEQGGR